MVLANDRETPASFRNAMVGSELQDLLTTQGKQVTRPGATKSQADIDIRDHDLGDEDFETEILEIGGTSGIAIAVGSEQGRTFEVKIQIHDDDDNVRETIDASDFDALGSARVTSVVPVFGDRVKFIITDTSGQAGNLISGSININIGTPEKVTANIEGGNITIEGANGAPFDEAALNAAIADDATSIVTYLSRALNSQGLDEFVSRVTDSTGSQIDPLTTAPLASVGSDSLLVDSNDPLDVSASTVPVEQQTPVGVEDSSGTQVDPAQNADGASSSASASGTGSSNAATISVPDGRSTFTVAYDVSGSTTVTVEVSPDGGSTWYPLTTYNPGSAATNADSLETGFDDVRAYVGANLNSLHVGAKGV